jgi:hypothetical protein
MTNLVTIGAQGLASWQVVNLMASLILAASIGITAGIVAWLFWKGLAQIMRAIRVMSDGAERKRQESDVPF